VPSVEIALTARARGLGRHLLARDTLEALAEAHDLAAFARGLSKLGTPIEPIGEPVDMPAVERAIVRTADRHLRILRRWQERTPGALDVFDADQDRRSLRALLRGAAEGAPAEARLDGLLPTPLLPVLALAELARQATPADVVAQLRLLAHPAAPRLQPLVRHAQPDLLAIDRVLLQEFADRATRAAAGGDETLRTLVGALIDGGNMQNALLIAGGPRGVDAAESFIAGGRWLSRSAFVSAASAGSQSEALTALTTALARSPLAASLPPVARDVAHLDRTLLAHMLRWLARGALLAPLGSAPLLRVLFRIEAQGRDLRALAWGAVLGTPPPLRTQQLVTPP
jgi:vacuolar-type H+-ATPase subunit C/Vma6